MKPNRFSVPWLFGVLALASVCSLTAYAADPVTDGILWTKDYPVLVQNGAKTRITIAGTSDTAKYKDIKITSKAPVYWYVVEVKGGKEVPATQKKFRLEINPVKVNPQIWDGSSAKEINNLGSELPFDGFPPGVYRVKVAVKVKETNASEERDAKLEKDIPIPAP